MMRRTNSLRAFLTFGIILLLPFAASAEKEKIVVAGWPAGDVAFKAILPDFNKAYPDIEVTLAFQKIEDHHQQLATAIAAGSGAPDVAMIEQQWIGKYKDSTGLENLLDAPYSAGAMKKDFVGYKWDLATSIDGKKVVGLVWDIGPATMFYRRDIFKEVGLPSEPAEVEKYFSTWDGVLSAAQKVYIPGKRWLLSNAADLYYWTNMNRDYYNEKLEMNLNKPGSIAALNAAITMRKKGWDAKQDLWSNETYGALGNGSIAMAVAGCWYGGFLKSWIAPKTSGLWGVARLPAKIADSNWGGSYLAIPSQGKHKDAAWKFVQFALATKDGQNGMFKAVDYFPGYIPAWNDPLYTEGDPFFAGENARTLWVSIAKNIRPTFSTLMDSTTESVMNTTVSTGLNEGLTAEQILVKAKADISAQTLEDRDNFIDILKKAGRWK
jgi:multiple sugar transport system substrate-binding protein